MRRPVSRQFLVPITLLVALLAGACGSGAATDSPASSAPPELPATPASAGSDGLFSVAPSDVAAGASSAFGDHLVGAPQSEPRGELLVFFPGTGADPSYYETLLGHALDLGDHVIGLAYPNASSVNFDLCAGDEDPTCPERARREVLFGEDAGDLAAPLEVSAAESAVARLDALLAHLAEAHPDQGWGTFLDGDAVLWDRIATAGHSQGGGHAAFLALDRELARVILFDATEPADWTTRSFATPADRMWGIAHTDEPIITGISRSWLQLGLPGETVDVEAGSAPWGGSHRLVTSTDECRGDPTSLGFHHNCPVVDDFLPDPMPDSLVDAWTLLLTG